jgi:predicted ATPase
VPSASAARRWPACSACCSRSRLFEQVRARIAETVPDIGRLGVRTRGEQLRVIFENSTGDLNLKDLGTGVEQLLMTIVVGLTESAPVTLVIEEPETNLHPAAQRALLGLLQGWAADRLIVAATHSAVSTAAVNCWRSAPATARSLLIRSRGGTTWQATRLTTILRARPRVLPRSTRIRCRC